MSIIANNLKQIKQRIEATRLTAGRQPADVRLIAVSKFQPVEAIEEALQAGHRLFGENRVQEAAAKFPVLRARYPDLELHMIGPLQSNKAEDAVRVFDVIETVDRASLVEALAKAMQKLDRWLPCYIEINNGGEAQKAGIKPEELGAFLALCRAHKLNITGLMCIPPQAQNPRGYFAELKQLALTHDLPHVSMGMSGDFEDAILAGASEVRLGTALFGARKPA